MGVSTLETGVAYDYTDGYRDGYGGGHGDPYMQASYEPDQAYGLGYDEGSGYSEPVSANSEGVGTGVCYGYTNAGKSGYGYGHNGEGTTYGFSEGVGTGVCYGYTDAGIRCYVARHADAYGVYWRRAWQLVGLLPEYKGGLLAWKCLSPDGKGRYKAPHKMGQKTKYHTPGNACAGPGGASRKQWSHDGYDILAAVIVPIDSEVNCAGILTISCAELIARYQIEGNNEFRILEGEDVARAFGLF